MRVLSTDGISRLSSFFIRWSLSIHYNWKTRRNERARIRGQESESSGQSLQKPQKMMADDTGSGTHALFGRCPDR